MSAGSSTPVGPSFAGGAVPSAHQLRLVEGLKAATIRAASVGSKHFACLAQTGELYIWGSGTQGQLGLGDCLDVVSPKLLRPVPSKAVQAVRCIPGIASSCGFCTFDFCTRLAIRAAEFNVTLRVAGLMWIPTHRLRATGWVGVHMGLCVAWTARLGRLEASTGWCYLGGRGFRPISANSGYATARACS